MTRRTKTAFARHAVLLAAGLALAPVVGCGDPASGDDDAPAPDATAGPDAGPQGPHPGEVWVMTWNIEAFPKSPSAAAKVAMILNREQPDVVVVQEIDDVVAFGALDDMLLDYTGVLADDAFGDIRVGALYRNDTVVLSDVTTLFKGDTDDFPRPPLAAKVTCQGFDFTIAVLHLKAGFDGASKERRRAAIVKLEAWARSHAVDSGDPDIVIAGDWNDELTLDGPANVFGPFLNSPSLYTFLDLPLGQAGQGTFVPNDAQLDHIMVTEDATVEYGAGSATILRLDDEDNQFEASVSDHRPMMVKFVAP